MTGTIKNLKHDKGFGFIKTASGKEFFFHRSGLRNCKFEDLTLGSSVNFEEEEQSLKGPRACDIYLQ